MSNVSDKVTKSLREFKRRRDCVLHEDEVGFEHHLSRLVDFCQNDWLIEPIITDISFDFTFDEWWKSIAENELAFPDGEDEELFARHIIIRRMAEDPASMWSLARMISRRISKKSEIVSAIRTVIIVPFIDILTERLENAANLATPEAIEQQAVPLERIPRGSEISIFLSHKSADKPLVNRYYRALEVLGFRPWLDESAMVAGDNLERELRAAFSKSCAAVFFLTDRFRDERYLAAEIDYAIIEKRKKDKKFQIISLRFGENVPIPTLLDPYIYRTIDNDLDGLCEILKALPIELRSVCWKKQIV